jgi:hypothetical protein
MTVQSTRFLMLGFMAPVSDRRRQSAISTCNFCPLGAQEARVAGREVAFMQVRALTHAIDLSPENRKVGGSTPPLPTTGNGLLPAVMRKSS